MPTNEGKDDNECSGAVIATVAVIVLIWCAVLATTWGYALASRMF